MVFKGIMAAATAVALATAPTVAAAQQAAPRAVAAAQVAPQEESVDGSELRGGFIIPLVAVVLVILAVVVLVDDNGDEPTSP